MNDPAEWEAIHQSRHWGTYPDIHVVRQVKKFMAGWKERGVPQWIAPRALDIGCGAGANALMMQSEGLNVLAFDGSPTAVQRVNESRKGMRATTGDVQTVEFPPESFDFILDNFTLTHIEHPPLERILSWLKPSGWLVHASFETAPAGAPLAWEHKEPGHVVERHTSWVEGSSFSFVVRRYVKPS